MLDLSIFNEEGIVLLSECTSYKSKFNIRCSKGHVSTTSLNLASLRHARGVLICTHCVKEKRRLELKERIKILLEKKGYELLSNEVDYNKKVTYRCNNGHTNSMAISNLLNDKSCPDCYGNVITPTFKIIEALSIHGYTLLDTNTTGSKTQFRCSCPKGHIFSTCYDTFVNAGCKCPYCVNNTSSKQEDDLFEFVSNLCKYPIERHNRTILEGKELDIFIPALKLAIEYCGLYWHSELKGKHRNYHLDKLNKCKEKGIRLITIFEDEWVLNTVKCKSRLASCIDSSSMRKIFARKCHITPISGSIAKAFCEINHIQNYGSGASIKLGAFYEEELVAVMTFSKPSLAKGRKKANGVEYELHRFCPKLNTVVVGGASKLMKFFERNYECDKLFTFADKRWSDANLYYKLGFKHVTDSDPCYYYFKEGNITRHHRFLYRKNVLESKLTIFDKNLTEVQNMYNNKFNRIFDCGNFKLCKEYDHA